MTSNTSPKIIFMGTPDFAVPSLVKLAQEPKLDIALVITQSDKAVGRKQILTPPSIKTKALELGLRVAQPEKLNLDEALLSELEALKPDYLVTVAYGQILKSRILNLAPVINLHASLLPDFKGPAPMNWALIHGDTELGLTTMLSDAGIDTGNILLQCSQKFSSDINILDLSPQLAELGANLLLETLLNINSIQATVQAAPSNPLRNLAPFMNKELGRIDFSQSHLILKSANPRQSDFELKLLNSSSNIHNLVRATLGWPSAYWYFKEQKITILKTQTRTLGASQAQAGNIVEINKANKSFFVACQEGDLEILEVKAEGKNQCSALDWLNGQRLNLGSNLSGL